jgi:hypothetical protein
MKIAITGHTSGIGKALVDNFKSHTVIGFSRSNGYNIADPAARAKILDQLADADMFINNAYSSLNNPQLILLEEVYELWKNTDKIIVNLSSRYTTGLEKYCKDKEQQDIFCKSKEFTLPYIINLKPGLVDTDRVRHIQGNRLSVEEVVATLNFALNTSCKIHTITFGK